MAATAVVADASVALKWFHAEGEEEVEQARELLRRHGQRIVALAVLDLTAYEVGNALLRGGPGVAATHVGVVLEALAELCPRWSLTAQELGDAVGLAERHHLTLYNAAYAAAARSRGARLATMDRRLLRTGLGQRPSVLLREIDSS